MEIDMKEILMIIKLLDKEHMFFKKVINIMENGLMEKKNGYGVSVKQTGEKYEGYWLDDMYHG